MSQVCSKGGTAVLTRYERGLAGLSGRACCPGASWPSAVARLFSLCSQVESSRLRDEEQAAGVLVERGVKGRSFRDAGALRGAVLRRALAVKGASGVPLRACPQLGLPAVVRARRTWRRCTGPCRPSARPSAEVGGVGAVALAPHRKPRWSTTTLRCSTGDEYEIDDGGARPRPAPALARAQRPHPHIEPIPHARAALRPPRALASPSPLSLAHAPPPRTTPARRPRCAPARWAHVLVSGALGSCREGSCWWPR